jgi:hypothetical protein
MNFERIFIDIKILLNTKLMCVCKSKEISSD